MFTDFLETLGDARQLLSSTVGSKILTGGCGSRIQCFTKNINTVFFFK